MSSNRSLLSSTARAWPSRCFAAGVRRERDLAEGRDRRGGGDGGIAGDGFAGEGGFVGDGDVDVYS